MKLNHIIRINVLKAAALAAVIMAVPAVLTSCSDDDDVKEVAGGDPYFEIPDLDGTVKMDVEGTGLTTWGSGQRYTVRSNARWKIVPVDESVESWAKVFPTEGIGDGYIRFYTGSNATPIRRVAEYNIYVDGIAEPFTVKMEQTESPAIFMPSARNVCFPRKGGNVDVAMDSNLDWDVEVTEGADWISASRADNLVKLSTSATATADGQHQGKVRVFAKEFPTIYTELNVTQTGAVYFDDFSWLIANADKNGYNGFNYAPQVWLGADLRIDKWVDEQVALNPGWTSVGNYVYSRWHYLKTGTGSNIGDICAPAVAEIPAGSNIHVSWNMLGYCNKSNARDPGNIFYVAVLGPGTITGYSAGGASTAEQDGTKIKYTSNGAKGGASTTLSQSAVFTCGPGAYFDTSDENGLDCWEHPDAQFSLDVTGAGPTTRIVFIFGDGGVDNKWKPVKYKTNRLEFDNYKVEIR